MIALEYDRPQHLVAGALQRRCGGGRRCRAVNSHLVEEPRGVGVERDCPSGGDRVRQPILELGEVARGDRPRVIVYRMIAVTVVFVPRVPAEQRPDAACLVGSVDRVVVPQVAVLRATTQEIQGDSRLSAALTGEP
jgi:hypothetical protein